MIPKHLTLGEIVQKMIAESRKFVAEYDATYAQQDEDLQLRQLIDNMRRNLAEYDRAKAVKGD